MEAEFETERKAYREAVIKEIHDLISKKINTLNKRLANSSTVGAVTAARANELELLNQEILKLIAK